VGYANLGCPELTDAADAAQVRRKKWGDRYAVTIATVSRLPPGCRYIGGKAKRLRRALLGAIHAAKGGLAVQDECLLQTILRHEVVALLIAHSLRVEGPAWRPELRLAYLRAFTAESRSRDKAVVALGLERTIRHELERMFAQPPTSVIDVQSAPKANGSRRA